MSGLYSPIAERDRRRRSTVRAVVLAVLVVLLAATAVLWPRPTHGALTVAAAAAVTPAGAVTGELAAVRSGDRVCYSIAERGATAVLRFVPGWSADTARGLKDPSGAVVAQPGDTVVLLGAPASVGTVAGCAQRGRIWTITGVTRRTAG